MQSFAGDPVVFQKILEFSKARPILHQPSKEAGTIILPVL